VYDTEKTPDPKPTSPVWNWVLAVLFLGTALVDALPGNNHLRGLGWLCAGLGSLMHGARYLSMTPGQMYQDRLAVLHGEKVGPRFSLAATTLMFLGLGLVFYSDFFHH